MLTCIWYHKNVGARLKSRACVVLQPDDPVRMPHSRNDPFHKISGLKTQAGGVDAGMAADIFPFEHILVNEKLHMVFFVVHQTQNA